MVTVFLRILRDRKISILVYCIAGILMLWMYVAMFPSIQQSADEFNQVLDAYPEAMLEVFNIEELSFNHIESFLAIEHFSIIWPMIVIFFAVSFATLSVASGIERGTIELPLAQPLSRTKLFIARYLAGLSAIALFSVCSIFMIIPLASIHTIDYVFANFAAVALLSFLFGWAVYSIAFLFSALFSERSKSFMATGMLLVLMYVLNIVASLKDSLVNLQYTSLFYYYDYYEALVNNTLNTSSLIVFVCIIVVFTIIAGYWFNRRDIAV